MRASRLAFVLAVLSLAACAKRGKEEPSAVSDATSSAARGSEAPSSWAPVAPVVSAGPKPSAEPPGGYVIARVLDVISIGQSDAVILVEPGNERVVPIFVGGSEALSIRLRNEGQRFHRPLTHDLLDALVKRLGGEVVKVQVDDLRGNTFVGRVFVWNGERLVDVDARPSDAIALAIGNHAPIFVAKRVFDAAGLRRKDIEDPERRRIELPSPKEPMAL